MASLDVLLKGDVCSKDQIEAYIELKWDEVHRVEQTPSPVEFDLYYSAGSASGRRRFGASGSKGPGAPFPLRHIAPFRTLLPPRHPARPLATGGVNILRHRAYFFAATALSFAMPAFAAEAPIYAAPGAWVVPNTAPLTDGPDARPWLLADRQVLIEGDKRSTFTDSAFRIASADMLRNWSDMRFEWQPDRDDLIIHRIAIIRDGKPIDLLAQGLKLDVLQRETDFEQRAIDGRLTATAPIEDLRVGDTVRFSTTLVERSRVMKGKARTSVGEGKSVAVRVDVGGCR